MTWPVRSTRDTTARVDGYRRIDDFAHRHCARLGSRRAVGAYWQSRDSRTGRRHKRRRDRGQRGLTICAEGLGAASLEARQRRQLRQRALFLPTTGGRRNHHERRFEWRARDGLKPPTRRFSGLNRDRARGTPQDGPDVLSKLVRSGWSQVTRPGGRGRARGICRPCSRRARLIERGPHEASLRRRHVRARRQPAEANGRGSERIDPGAKVLGVGRHGQSLTRRKRRVRYRVRDIVTPATPARLRPRRASSVCFTEITGWRAA